MTSFFLVCFQDAAILPYSVGSSAHSRFLLSALSMLTGEHEAVDLSMLVSEGLLGLSQSVMRQVHVHEVEGVVFVRSCALAHAVCMSVADTCIMP